MRDLLRLVSYLRFHVRIVVAAVVAVSGAIGFTAATPQVLRYAIDAGVTGQSKQALGLAAVLLILFSIGKGAFAYFQAYLGESLSQHVAFDLRRDFYERVQTLSFAFHDGVETGQLMSRATVDIENSRNFIGQSLLRLFYTLGLLGAVAVIMVRLDWKLGALTLLTMPTVAFTSYYVSRRTAPLWARVQQLIGVETTVLQESIAGMRVVKAFAQEDQQYERFRTANWGVRERSLVANRIQSFSQPFLIFILNTITVLILLYGGAQVLAGALTIGTLFAFIEYRAQLAMPIRQIGLLVNQGTRASAAVHRVFEVIDALSEVREAPDATPLESPQGHVRFEHVTFSYSPEHIVLDDVNIDARPGEMIALLGETASGKTTLTNLLPRFYDVTAGQITIDGRDIRSLTLESLRRHVGVVLQDPFMFSATIRENITYGKPGATDAEVEAAARAAQLHDFVVSLPDGYDTWVGERGQTLSGGQKQRIAIARMLLLDPRVLILDDSTSAVDMETEYLIQQALARLMEGRTSFVIAHRIQTAKRASQIVVLERGKIVQHGTHAELVREPGYYQELNELQAADEATVVGETPGEAGPR